MCLVYSNEELRFISDLEKTVANRNMPATLMNRTPVSYSATHGMILNG
jgi:hypothetical protein